MRSAGSSLYPAPPPCIISLTRSSKSWNTSVSCADFQRERRVDSRRSTVTGAPALFCSLTFPMSSFGILGGRALELPGARCAPPVSDVSVFRSPAESLTSVWCPLLVFQGLVCAGSAPGPAADPSKVAACVGCGERNRRA